MAGTPPARHMDVKRQQRTVCVASTRAGGRAFLGSAGGTGFRSTRCLTCPSVGPVDGVCPPTHCQQSPLPRRAQAMMRASVCHMPQSLLRLHHPRTSATQRRGEESSPWGEPRGALCSAYSLPSGRESLSSSLPFPGGPFGGMNIPIALQRYLPALTCLLLRRAGGRGSPQPALSFHAANRWEKRLTGGRPRRLFLCLLGGHQTANTTVGGRDC